MTNVKIALFVVACAALAYFQIRSFISRGEKRDTAAYTVLMLTAMVIGTMLLADVRLLSPAAPLRAVFEPIGKLFFPAQ